MMNLEQLEAACASLQKSSERLNRLHGWRVGIPIETRRARIKRLRRFNRLPERFPDRFTYRPGNDRSVKNFRLVSSRRVAGGEIFVTAFDLIQVQWNEDHSEILPPEEWPYVTRYNGYCRFPSKPVLERGWDGILTYIPAHGGITYCDHKLGVSTYGFDTSHAGDDENPLVKNVEWVEHQALVLMRAIKVAARFERAYLRSQSNFWRSRVLHRYHEAVLKKSGQPFRPTNNFGTMMRLISGQL